MDVIKDCKNCTHQDFMNDGVKESCSLGHKINKYDGYEEFCEWFNREKYCTDCVSYRIDNARSQRNWLEYCSKGNYFDDIDYANQCDDFKICDCEPFQSCNNCK